MTSPLRVGARPRQRPAGAGGVSGANHSGPEVEHSREAAVDVFVPGGITSGVETNSDQSSGGGENADSIWPAVYNSEPDGDSRPQTMTAAGPVVRQNPPLPAPD